jgi:tRNA(Ile)-lysidine synthase
MKVAMELLLLPIRDALVLHSGANRIDLDRDAFLAMEAPIRSELLRSLVGGMGGRLSESGTDNALEFMRKGSSGKAVRVDDSLLLSRDFAKFTLVRDTSGGRPNHTERIAESLPVAILDPVGGKGSLVLLGRRFEVQWGTRPSASGWSWIDLPEGGLNLPLLVRGWKPGDRMRTQGGEKKLKKLFVELRIPVRDRPRTPLLVEATGEVIWIAGWKSGVAIPPLSADAPRWGVGIRPADGS